MFFGTERLVSENESVSLLGKCSLGAQRPMEDSECIRGMLENSDMMASAWDGDKLVGIARSVTDFRYACSSLPRRNSVLIVYCI